MRRVLALTVGLALACGAPEAQEYPASWSGVCQRMVDCECAQFDTIAACVEASESASARAEELAQELGVEVDVAPSDALLSQMANASCREVCEPEAGFE